MYRDIGIRLWSVLTPSLAKYSLIFFFPFTLPVFKINFKHELLKGYTINVTF